MHLYIREQKGKKLFTGLYFRAEIAEVGRQAQLDQIVISTVSPKSRVLRPIYKTCRQLCVVCLSV